MGVCGRAKSCQSDCGPCGQALDQGGVMALKIFVLIAVSWGVV